MARRLKNTAWSSRPRRVLVLLGVFGIVAGAVFGGVALGKNNPPTVSSINLASSSPTSASSVAWTVTFSTSVTGVSASNFTLVKSGLGGTPAVMPVSGSGSTWTVTASTGSGSGTLQLNLTSDVGIKDGSNTQLSNTLSGQAYTIDRTAPTATSIVRADASPTNASSLHWTVSFSEPVSGLAISNFQPLTNTANLGGSAPMVSSVAPSGAAPTATWTVTVSTAGTTGQDSGSIELDLKNAGAVKDAVGNPLATSSLAGQAYTFDTQAPTVSSIVRVGSSPTFAASVSWTVTFGESVTGVTTSDFSLSSPPPGPALSGTPLVTGVSGSGAAYTVTAVTGTGNGTLALVIPGAGSITDLSGNALTAAAFPVTGPAYTFVPQPYSLFAGDATCSDAGISLGGKYNVFWAAHSNGAFTMLGSYNTFGTSDAGCTPTVGGKGNAFGRNSASTPSAGPNNLPYPQTYDRTNVCSQPGAHNGATFTIANGSSGIYCATSSITFASSNITATVTLVAPSIQMNGSGLNLTPAYGNLIAFDTNTTLGNTGLSIALNGGNDTFHNGTLYDPYGAITVGGSNSNFDGFFEGYTISISGSNNTFTGEGPASYLSVTGDVGPVWPGGGAVPIPVMFTNNNGNAKTVTNLDVSIVISSVPAGCNPNDFTINQSNIGPTQPLNVPANNSVTLPAQGVAAPTITYSDGANPYPNGSDQHTCESAKFTLSYLATDTNGSNTGTVTVGTPTPFTVSFGTASGGALLPTTLTDPNRTVDTVPVTVTNTDGGAEYLHTLTYRITPGWTKTTGGPHPCTAADFSIDGLAVNTPDTVTYNEEIQGSHSIIHNFTIQIVDRHDNHPGDGTGDQDACKGAMPSITVSAN